MLTTENSLVLAIDFQDRLMPSMHDREELARKTAIFLKGCRLLGVPIIATQQYTKGLGDTISEIKDALGEFKPIEKITFSCCGNVEFIKEIKELGRKNIIVTGIEAHICVQQTVLDIVSSGYDVYVVADCIGSRFVNDRLYAEKLMDKAGAVFYTAESALFEMMVSAEHPRRKEISELIK